MYRNIALLGLIVFASSALGRPDRAKMEERLKKCAEEIGVDFESIRGPDHPNWRNDPKFKCFGACMMKQSGDMNEDGTVNIENTIERLPANLPNREEVVEAIKECGSKAVADECETAFAIFECMREKNVFPHFRGPHGHH